MLTLKGWKLTATTTVMIVGLIVRWNKMDGYNCRWIGGHYDYCLYNDHQVEAEDCAEDCIYYEVKE